MTEEHPMTEISQDAITAARTMVRAAGRMLDRWAESTPDVRNRDLWEPLHRAADELRALLEPYDGLSPRHALEAMREDHQPAPTTQETVQGCPNCAPGYDCERGIYTPEATR